MIWLLVPLAGALGATLRFALDRIIMSTMEVAFPFGTLVVNLFGATLLGLSSGYHGAGWPGSPAQTVVQIGFIGAFTTLSTLSFETLSLARVSRRVWPLVNVVVSVGGGIALFMTASALTTALS